MLFELPMGVVMIALDGCFLERPVYALDLSVGPRMLRFCQAMFDAVFITADVKHMPNISCCRAVPIAGLYSRASASVRAS